MPLCILLDNGQAANLCLNKCTNHKKYEDNRFAASLRQTLWRELQGNSRKGFGICRLSCLCAEG